MKKTIVTLILSLFTITGITSVQAQTMEETIGWIKGEIERFATDSQTIIVTPCLIHISSSDTNVYKEFDPGAAEWEAGDFGIGAKGKKEVIDVNAGGYVRTAWAFSLQHGDSALYKRFAQALNHLATFCKKEKAKTF